MKTRLLNVVAVGGLTAAAVAVVTPATSFAQASTNVDRRSVSITFDQLNPCNGETVVISGTLDITTRTTIDGKGRKHISFTDVPHLDGQGTTGAYKVVGVSREHDTFEVDGSDLPMTQSFTSRVHVISQGKAPNYFDDFATHYSIDANGNMDVQFSHSDSRCTGN